MFSLSSLALPRIPVIFRLQFTVSDASLPAIPPSQNSILNSSKFNVRFPTFMSNFQFFGIKSSTEAIVDEDDDSSSSKRREKASILRVGLICGGPSMERGISRNSARQFLIIFKEMICVLAATTLTVSSMLMPYLLLSSIQTPLRILILSLKALLKVFAACQNLWNTLLLQLILCFLLSMVLLVKMVRFRYKKSMLLSRKSFSQKSLMQLGIQELLEQANVPFVQNQMNLARHLTSMKPH